MQNMASVVLVRLVKDLSKSRERDSGKEYSEKLSKQSKVNHGLLVVRIQYS